MRLALTVAGCDFADADETRTARVRDGDVVVVTGVMVDAEVTVVPVLPLLLIIVGSDAADGIVRLPIAGDVVTDGAATAAVVLVVAVRPLLD